MGGDGRGEIGAEPQPRAMDPGPHGIGREIAGLGDLVVAEARDLPHQEDVPVDVAERRQRLVDCRDHILGRRALGFYGRRNRWRRALAAAVVIDDQVAGDPKEPRPQLRPRGLWHDGTADAQEDVLGKFLASSAWPTARHR